MKKFFHGIMSRNSSTVNIKTKSMRSRQFPYNIEVIAENLYIPWAMDISYEGKIYFTERSGTIRAIEKGILNPQPLFTFGTPFVNQGEGGLMGIVLDPIPK